MNNLLETLDLGSTRQIIKSHRPLRSLKIKEVVEGAIYVGKVNGKLVPVKVSKIFEFHGRKHFSIHNLDTGRDTTFRSASKLYTIVPKPVVTAEDLAACKQETFQFAEAAPVMREAITNGCL